jgi:hypothetical protein
VVEDPQQWPISTRRRCPWPVRASSSGPVVANRGAGGAVARVTTGASPSDWRGRAGHRQLQEPYGAALGWRRNRSPGRIRRPGTNLGHERSAGSAPRRRVRASAVPLMAWLLQGRQSGPASPQQARYGWVWTRFGGEATPEETGRCKESVTTGLPSRGRPNRSASLLHMASRRRGAGPLTRPCNFGSKAYVPQPQTTQAATWREVSISLRCSFCLLMDP